MFDLRPVSAAMQKSSQGKKERIGNMEQAMAQIFGITPKQPQKSPTATASQNPFKKKRSQQQSGTLLQSSPQADPAFHVGGSPTLLG